MTTTLDRYLLALLLLALIPSALPQAEERTAQRRFEIELIVFTRGGTGVGGEIWPADPGILDWDSALPPGSYEIQPRNAWQLGTLERILGKTKGRIVPLIHLAWQQPVQSRRAARPVYLKSSRKISAGTALVEGLAKISVGRYLHLDLDLLLRGIPAAGEDFPDKFRTYRFSAHRKMRSGELHYIDHPKMGVLIEIRKIEPPKETEQSSPENTTLEQSLDPAATTPQGTNAPATERPSAE